ncbi:MAG: hypothetical protein HZB51_00965 [Chloroflexi bacterium]|nr:hypothetical protein [Chloroflexota bacterium]
MVTSQVAMALDRLVPSPEEFSIEAWARLLEKFEHRSIQFVGVDLPAGYFGACIIVEEESVGVSGVLYPITEYVVYSNCLPPSHREHVKAHELAHIALGHSTLVLSPTEFVNWNPSSEPHSAFCWRASCASDPSRKLQNDQEAELLTRRVFQRVFAWQQKVGFRQRSSLQKLESALWRSQID